MDSSVGRAFTKKPGTILMQVRVLGVARDLLPSQLPVQTFLQPGPGRPPPPPPPNIHMHQHRLHACKKSQTQSATVPLFGHTQILYSAHWQKWVVMGAGIAQWLEHRTRDWKVAGSNPCWNGGRIFFSRVDFLCWLFISVSVPPPCYHSST